MSDTATDSAVRRQRLHEVLLGYLEGPQVILWPGADGLTLGEALLGYAEAAAAGQVPDQQELLQRHPELAEELRAFFAEQGLHRPAHAVTS
jgi:hypothetical protein